MWFAQTYTLASGVPYLDVSAEHTNSGGAFITMDAEGFMRRQSTIYYNDELLHRPAHESSAD
jgi:hypothetical protein